MSMKSAHGEYPRRVPMESTHERCPWRLPTEGAHEDHPGKVPIASTHERCQWRVPIEGVHGDYPWRVPHGEYSWRVPLFTFQRYGILEFKDLEITYGECVIIPTLRLLLITYRPYLWSLWALVHTCTSVGCDLMLWPGHTHRCFIFYIAPLSI